MADSKRPHTALVLEGGGFRGLFTSGVLDVLMERGVWGFSDVWGVSAGALVGSSYVSRQVGRSARINLAYHDDDRYMGPRQLVRTGNIMSTTFLYERVQDELDPFDYATFNASSTRMWCVMSDVVFGTPAYHLVRELPRDTAYLRASASLPLVSQMVELDGHRYLDGGTTDSVPVERALEEEGVEGALVVLTQHREFVKRPMSMLRATAARYADYPYYLAALRDRHLRYNAQRKRIWELEGQGRVVVVAPPRPVEVANTGGTGAELLDLYVQGRQAAEGKLAEIAGLMGA